MFSERSFRNLTFEEERIEQERLAAIERGPAGLLAERGEPKSIEELIEIINQAHNDVCPDPNAGELVYEYDDSIGFGDQKVQQERGIHE